MTIVVIRTEKKEIERPETKKKKKKKEKKVHPIKTRARSVWIFSRDNADADITGNRITSVMSAFFPPTLDNELTWTYIYR